MLGLIHASKTAMSKSIESASRILTYFHEIIYYHHHRNNSDILLKYKVMGRTQVYIYDRNKSCNKTHKWPLTLWGRVMHICVSKLTIIGSENGLLTGCHQAIIWTNAGVNELMLFYFAAYSFLVCKPFLHTRQAHICISAGLEKYTHFGCGSLVVFRF